MPAILGLIEFLSIFGVLPSPPHILFGMRGPAGWTITTAICLSAEFPAAFRTSIFTSVECRRAVACKRVYLWRNYAKMLDVAAGRVLTEMINLQTFWNRTMRVLPEDSMKELFMPLKANISVAFMKPASPNMTPSRLIGLDLCV